jgi:hypothetical protein
MSIHSRLPRHLRPRREKVFGSGGGLPLDREAKHRILIYACAYNARHRQPGQHRGPLTRATMEVLEALLWGFHNAKDGRCFPSYEAIAAKAECCRDTVCQAIHALERADILTWVNRIVRQSVREIDLFGKWSQRWRILRTSNAYVFRDPLPCAVPREPSKTENPSGTMNSIFSYTKQKTVAPAPPLDQRSGPLVNALNRLGATIAAQERPAMT